MSRKSKIDPIVKVKIVEQYLDREIGLGQASKNLGVAYQSIRKWISIYQCNGPTGLLNQPKNKSYSKALKISAVNDYLNGAGSLDDICLKYGIRSHTQLLKWIQVYNSGGILKTSTGGACMKKVKSTTLDERLKIVMKCLANDKNYGAMALKYQCSYQQVRNWVKRYEEMGSKGLEDRRGRRVGSLPSRTSEEELRDRIVELERKNLDLQMENDLLKKVRELERRDHIAKNYLHRDFHADKPNEKWLTDVSEFKYYSGNEVHKIYLSAILDLYDRRIVTFKISDHNDNPLVMNTFDEAVCLEPDAHPLFHSDRGFQYTSAQFCTRLKKHHMKQSMSRVAHCIDNGPMEGFWGIPKREMYYCQHFNDRTTLIAAITDYIHYYNNQRLQRKLNVMTPMEYHDQYIKAA